MNSRTKIILRRTAPALLVAVLAACSGGEQQGKQTGTTTGGPGGAPASGKYEEFAAGCNPLTEIEQYMSEDAFNAAEVKKLMEKARAGAESVPDESVQKAIIAFADTPVDAGSKFSDAYSNARKACAEWGASFSGGKPQNSGQQNNGQQSGSAADQEEVALYRQTCEPVINIAKSFQEGTLDVASVPQTVEKLAPLVNDVKNAEAKAALQALAEGINDGSEPMPLFASAVQACGAWGTEMAKK